MFLYMVFFVALHSFVLSFCYPDIRQTAGGKDFCIVEGKPYRSGDRILRDHPCHVCYCHLGRAECSWMNCPPAPEGCTEYRVDNYCNPALYVCDIPEHLIGVRQKRSLQRYQSGSDIPPKTIVNRTQVPGDCNILGVPYHAGDLMGIATSFCLECRCANHQLYCSPKCCFNYAKYYLTPREKAAAARSPTIPLRNPLSHILSEFEE